MGRKPTSLGRGHTLTMNDELSQECIRRLICTVLRRTGFDATSPDALIELEDKVLMLMGGLLDIAHYYAELARRTRASPRDIVYACSNQGIDIDSLQKTIDDNQKARQSGDDTDLPIELQSEPSPSSTFTASEIARRFLADEPNDTTRRASCAPDFLPFLPPSHSYKRTPTFPSLSTAAQAKAAGLSLLSGQVRSKADVAADEAESTSADARMVQLDAQIRTTRLVEASLQNLIRATSQASQSAHDNDEQAQEEKTVVDDFGNTTSVLTFKRGREDLTTLMKRYEKDAALCNFEIDWYGSGGGAGSQTSSNTNPTAGHALVLAGAASQARKKGRWKF